MTILLSMPKRVGLQVCSATIQWSHYVYSINYSSVGPGMIRHDHHYVYRRHSTSVPCRQQVQYSQYRICFLSKCLADPRFWLTFVDHKTWCWCLVEEKFSDFVNVYFSTLGQSWLPRCHGRIIEEYGSINHVPAVTTNHITKNKTKSGLLIFHEINYICIWCKRIDLQKWT